MTKVGLIGEELGGGEIVGILVFLHEGDEPPHPTGITTRARQSLSPTKARSAFFRNPVVA